MIITIDGPAGTGKSTVARKLAHLLKIPYFDTGALYRAVSWMLLEQNISMTDEEKIETLLSDFPFRIEVEGTKEKYFLGEVEITKKIRSSKVTAMVSKVAALKVVRAALLPLQKKYAQGGNAVFDGRDLGTVVFPNAELKFFLTAREEVRAQRRYLELSEKFSDEKATYEKVFKNLKKRDQFDTNRPLAPLVPADDAVLIDTSDLTIEEVVEKMATIYEAKKGEVR